MRSNATITIAALAAIVFGVAATEPSDTQPDGAAPPSDLEFHVDALLGLVPPDEVEEYYARAEEEIQLQIQECMDDAGFEYELESQVPGADDDPTAVLSDLEWAEQWGFGIYTLLDPAVSLWPEELDDIEWPNEEYLESLTPDERDRWFAANDACAIEASAAADPWSNPMVGEVIDEFFAMIDTEPRVAAALAEWRDCMTDAGYEVEHPEQVYDLVFDPELIEQFGRTAAWEPDSIDHDIWLDAVEHEIDAAVATATCTPDYLDVRTGVAAEHRDELIETLVTEVDWSLDPLDDIGFYPEDEPVPGTEPDAGSDDETSSDSASR